MVFFPTENDYIGSALYSEISTAKKYKIPIYCYDKNTKKFTKNFELGLSEFLSDEKMYNIFCRKIKILE